VIHALRRSGRNAQIGDNRGIDEELALAAGQVIVTTEEIVPEHPPTWSRSSRHRAGPAVPLHLLPPCCDGRRLCWPTPSRSATRLFQRYLDSNILWEGWRSGIRIGIIYIYRLQIVYLSNDIMASYKDCSIDCSNKYQQSAIKTGVSMNLKSFSPPDRRMIILVLLAGTCAGVRRRTGFLRRRKPVSMPDFSRLWVPQPARRANRRK
jgi:hypothetical protein